MRPLSTLRSQSVVPLPTIGYAIAGVAAAAAFVCGAILLSGSLSPLQQRVVGYSCLLSALASLLSGWQSLKALRRAWTRSSGTLASLLEAVPEGVFEVAESGIITFANEHLCALFGYPWHELVGAPVEMLVPSCARSHHAQQRAAFFAAGHSRPMGNVMEIKGLRKDGALISIDISLTRIMTSHGPAIYGLVRDMSPLKAHECRLMEANARLTATIASLEQSAHELQQLTELGDLLHSSVTEHELFTLISCSMERLFPRLSGGLFILNPAHSVADAVSTWGPDAPVLRPDWACEDCWAVRRSRPHSSTGAGDPPRCRHYVDADFRPCYCVPLLAHGECLGVLHLFARSIDDADCLITAGRPQLVQALANQIALSTANLRLRETLKQESLIDPLTGLYNRRALQDWLERDIAKPTRAQGPLAVLLLDLDHFKRFNDRHGHECGDVALREFGAMLRRSLRTDDLVCRLGGEEFAALLPHTKIADALGIAELLRRNTEALCIVRGGRNLGALTVSIGVATLGPQTDSIEQLLRRADRALYRAKANGRNQVILSGCAEETGVYRLPGAIEVAELSAAEAS